MRTDIAALISDNLDIWTTAVERKSGVGRGGRKLGFHGIERLRALILDLAVRGKLVPQDAEDEPAHNALRKIAKARQQKLAAGIARKPKALAPLPADLTRLPSGWAWTQLGTIAEIGPGNSAADDIEASFVPMAMISTSISGEHGIEIRKWGEIKKGFTQFAEGDIGLAKITPCFENGKAAIFQNLRNGIGAGTTELHVARPWSEDVNRRYLLLTMKTGSYLAKGEKQMTGTAGQKRVTRAYFEASPLPLPPLAEQQRIVAKVDELMALCDALEEQSASALAVHQTLVETLLATLVNSADATDLATNWARLKIHFDILFSTEAAIDALKQTVLELAVRGRLVPQNENDPSVLLPNFREVSKSSEWDKKVFLYGSKIFALPKNWTFAPLSQLCSHIVDCPHTTPKWTDDGELCVRTNQIKPRHLDLSEPNFVSAKTYVERVERLEPAPGDILYIREGGILGVGCRIPGGVRLCLGQRSMLIRCNPTVAPEYVEIALNSPFVVSIAKHFTTGGAAPRVNMSTVRGYPIPTPPLAEQQRIVAKVDELMALCDKLKARLFDAAATQKQLAAAIVERAAA
ncbi:restriction endonuclease subunit S [Rhizobium sp. CB3060]|uniref:restriction endonuclease subunit S n=1 Tax=Rhizobium sp. CB3060 TaxID=3138255 RepID=UPI0021A5D677|nr:restriction endonuclease subunit S [Rhizobium tropici]UWU20939.1 restriction endonuclease subunit S [Rhizobium tropici]